MDWLIDACYILGCRPERIYWLYIGCERKRRVNVYLPLGAEQLIGWMVLPLVGWTGLGKELGRSGRANVRSLSLDT